MHIWEVPPYVCPLAGSQIHHDIMTSWHECHPLEVMLQSYVASPRSVKDMSDMCLVPYQDKIAVTPVL
jgi:hypothetical protein